MSNKKIVREALKQIKSNMSMDQRNWNRKHTTKIYGALGNLYDKAALIEKLEGMRLDESLNNYGGQRQRSKTHNTAIDAVIKELKK